MGLMPGMGPSAPGRSGRRILTTAVVVSLAVAGPPSAGAAAEPAQAGSAGAPAELAISSVPIDGAVVRDSGGGVRGPALATLPDGRILLGGGADGRRLLVADATTGEITEAGTVIRPDQRRDDARFAPTDIEVMSTTSTRARLYLAFPELVAARGCVRVAVNRVDLALRGQPRIIRTAKVFRSTPCVPPAAIQHASGRLARLDRTRAYLTVGDLGDPRIAKRGARGQLGSVLRIGEGSKTVRISQGHRNSQGLLVDHSGNLWQTEHGPRGGDELNLIRRGRDYGWPFVTLGQPYGAGDYVLPRRTGTHAGFTRPRTAWVPSVATSEVVQVPASWPGWSGRGGADLLMGTLKDEALWRIRVDSAEKVRQRQRIPVGHRIRDMDTRRGGTIAATTDDGRLLILSARP